MSEQLPQHEPLTLSPGKLRRIADQVAKKRYIAQIDQEMGDDTPDIVGLRPSDYNTDGEIYNTVLYSLPRGSSREDVGPVLRQIDQLIEDAGGLEAYLAAETERRMQKEAERSRQRPAEQEPDTTGDEVATEPQEQEAPHSADHSPKTRRSFGRSILNRFSGK